MPIRHIATWLGLAMGTAAMGQSLMRAPLDIEPRVSGTFAELRANHFHSGLDLSTSGRTGLPVHAAEAGYVSRIKVSAFGYGKALYIDHPDGTTTVYAHLSAYAGAIADSVRAAQYARQSFEVEIFPKRGALSADRLWPIRATRAARADRTCTLKCATRSPKCRATPWPICPR